MKVVKLSALCTGRLYSPGNIPGTNFCYRLSRPQGHSAAGRIVSMKNSNDTIGNLTRDLATCSAVPQPTAPPPSPDSPYNATKLRNVGPVRCMYKLTIWNNILNVSCVTTRTLYLIPRTIILNADVYEKLGKFYMEFVPSTVTFDQYETKVNSINWFWYRLHCILSKS